MTDEDVVGRVAAMFGRKMGCWQARDERWLPTYLVRITGAKAVAWMTANALTIGLITVKVTLPTRR